MRSGWGAHDVGEVMANLALLCPLCNRVPQPPRSVALGRLPWFPACAGMTEGVHFARGTSWGVQRGKAPLRFFLSPKSGGQRGLIYRFRAAMALGFALLYQPYSCVDPREAMPDTRSVRTLSGTRRPHAAA